MKKLYLDYLFSKRMYVCCGKPSENPKEILFCLANAYGIRIVKGGELAFDDMVPYTAKMMGEAVPEPFYRGFPESVRKLSQYQLFLDKALHYTITYGFGDFSKPGHSVFETEEDRRRAGFREDTKVRDFQILTKKEAEELFRKMVTDLLSGTRPLSWEQYGLVSEFIADYDYIPEKIASKNTCVRLLADTREMGLLRFLSLSDVIKFVDELNYRNYDGNRNVRKLNLKNRDRKFIATVIDALIEDGKCDLSTCYEKKQIWSGLLHHIHYQPKTEEGRKFAEAMRGRENHSVYSDFEKKMAAGDIPGAVDVLKAGKGSGALLRNLDYLLSRCESLEDMSYVLEHAETRNQIILLQLLQKYDERNLRGGARTFRIARYDQMLFHTETESEMAKRRSQISAGQAKMLSKKIRENLQELLKDRVGKVYIDPDMKNYAVPLQESASMGGFGVLPRGSRKQIESGRVIRAFTYWEKVHDIDLSVFLLSEDGKQQEISWRSFITLMSDSIVYSGDETSGFEGGSEYFDVDVAKTLKEYPEYRYLVFCDNVFSGTNFSQCVCKAGYMIRKRMSSGEVYEPKTVQSSFVVNCESTFAYLFGIDIYNKEFIWLNLARESNERVAGETSMAFLLNYLHTTEVFNLEDLFRMMATQVVDTPEEADIVVTDKTMKVPEGKEVIREYDIERIIALINGN